MATCSADTWGRRGLLTMMARCSRSRRRPGGYASAPTTLVSFNGDDGEVPKGGLIVDANGDLFGATDSPRTATAQCLKSKRLLRVTRALPPQLVRFDGARRRGARSPPCSPTPVATCSARPRLGGLKAISGTVFEIPAAALLTTASAGRRLSDGILWQNTGWPGRDLGDGRTNVIGGGTVSPNPGPSWNTVGTGDFNKDGQSDILWQNTMGRPRSGT